MSREEFTELLRAKGYDAKIQDGTITVYGVNKKIYRIVEGIANSVGYYGRFNWSGRESDVKT